MFSAEQFADVYDKYVEKIYRFVFVKVNSEEVAQDLTSETFTRTFEYIRKEKGEIENVQAFLYRSARNLVFDYYRQKSRSNVSLEYESQDMVEKKAGNKDMPDFLAQQGEAIAHLREALSAMENEYGDILTLYYIEDMPIREIAEILGRPEGTIRVMLHRGLKDLKTRLTRNGYL